MLRLVCAVQPQQRRRHLGLACLLLLVDGRQGGGGIQPGCCQLLCQRIPCSLGRRQLLGASLLGALRRQGLLRRVELSMRAVQLDPQGLGLGPGRLQRLIQRGQGCDLGQKNTLSGPFLPATKTAPAGSKHGETMHNASPAGARLLLELLDLLRLLLELAVLLLQPLLLLLRLPSQLLLLVLLLEAAGEHLELQLACCQLSIQRVGLGLGHGPGAAAAGLLLLRQALERSTKGDVLLDRSIQRLLHVAREVVVPPQPPELLLCLLRGRRLLLRGRQGLLQLLHCHPVLDVPGRGQRRRHRRQRAEQQM